MALASPLALLYVLQQFRQMIVFHRNSRLVYVIAVRDTFSFCVEM